MAVVEMQTRSHTSITPMTKAARETRNLPNTTATWFNYPGELMDCHRLEVHTIAYAGKKMNGRTRVQDGFEVTQQ